MQIARGCFSTPFVYLLWVRGTSSWNFAQVQCLSYQSKVYSFEFFINLDRCFLKLEDFLSKLVSLNINKKHRKETRTKRQGQIDQKLTQIDDIIQIA